MAASHRSWWGVQWGCSLCWSQSLRPWCRSWWCRRCSLPWGLCGQCCFRAEMGIKNGGKLIRGSLLAMFGGFCVSSRFQSKAVIIITISFSYTNIWIWKRWKRHEPKIKQDVHIEQHVISDKNLFLVKRNHFVQYFTIKANSWEKNMTF